MIWLLHNWLVCVCILGKAGYHHVLVTKVYVAAGMYATVRTKEHTKIPYADRWAFK